MTSTAETSSAPAEQIATLVAETHERLRAVRGAHDPAAPVLTTG